MMPTDGCNVRDGSNESSTSVRWAPRAYDWIRWRVGVGRDAGRAAYPRVRSASL